jgi:hypothetical protein
MNVRFFVPRVKRLWLFEDSESQKSSGRGVQDETGKRLSGRHRLPLHSAPLTGAKEKLFNGFVSSRFLSLA